ncbi:MAG: transglutaminase family protein [Paracoccaceae bacterium]|nr:transglutaminase family protein [Paracoccaceae bacterium]
MLLKIFHQTRYSYDTPVPYGLLQLRLVPPTGPGQDVRSWKTSVTGGRKETSFRDHFRNTVELVSTEPETDAITVTCEGSVDVSDNTGITGPHRGFVPLWLFRRTTAMTDPGRRVGKLIREFSESGPTEGGRRNDGRKGDDDGDIARLHRLSARVRERIDFEPGRTDATTRAEDALAAGRGVCQDHTHVFLSAARGLGFPARYVSGYLLTHGQNGAQASHAWAEVHVEDLGWVGFDISNGISPDDRYARVATGLDYMDAAPIRGMRFGNGGESLDVTLQVQQ